MDSRKKAWIYIITAVVLWLLGSLLTHTARVAVEGLYLKDWQPTQGYYFLVYVYQYKALIASLSQLFLIAGLFMGIFLLLKVSIRDLLL